MSFQLPISNQLQTQYETRINAVVLPCWQSQLVVRMSTQSKESYTRGVCGMAAVSIQNTSYDGEAMELSMVLSKPSVMLMQDRMVLPLVLSNEARIHEAVD